MKTRARRTWFEHDGELCPRLEKGLTDGGFEDVGAFYRYCARELRISGPRVRELAGYSATDKPDVILGYEGWLGALQIACATAAALPHLPTPDP